MYRKRRGATSRREMVGVSRAGYSRPITAMTHLDIEARFAGSLGRVDMNAVPQSSRWRVIVDIMSKESCMHVSGNSWRVFPLSKGIPIEL
jgi:hypothetical protein